MPLHVSGCDQCGQQDDHPKVHVYPEGTYHHDCLPYSLKADVVANHPIAAQIIAAAESGVHGDDLRQHIFTLHETQES